jgi:F420-dependent oxidoreductase-like protein
MIEGQEDVTWEQWVALARACEESGIETLFRSDHYLSVQGEHGRASLDAWATLNALAAITSRLRLGTLVSPATCRHPSVLAKMVVTADHVSGGRVELGMGAGWLEAEHRAYGFPFPPLGERMERLEEQLQIVTGAWADGPFDFSGRHYAVEDLDALPKPVQRPAPPIILGGRGKPRGLRLAARWGDEYNTVMASAEECRKLRGRLDDACENAGRDRIPLSLMTGVLVGADQGDLDDRRRRLEERHGAGTVSDAWITGTPGEALEQLRELDAAGVERIMLQHLLHDDLDAVELIGRELIQA